jgi:hypothetical protein
MRPDPFTHTVTCTVCGFARGIRGVKLACLCRGWVVHWREILTSQNASEIVTHGQIVTPA